MAIIPANKYPGKTAGTSPAYPLGKARNVTVPGDGTGTPWEEGIVNDWFGFSQSVLAASGQTATGNPDEVGNSQIFLGLDAVCENNAGLIAADLAEGQRVGTKGFSSAGDGGGDIYLIVAATTEPQSFVQNLANGKFAVSLSQVISPLQVGYTLDLSGMTSVAAVNANFDILKQLLVDLKGSQRQLIKFDTIWTPETLHAEWLAGRNAPVGWYSDSTTDGAQTTGHVSSTGGTSPFEVTINESPNAYPAKFKTYINEAASFTTGCESYNGGFDGESFRSGFGLQQWYNTWFRGLAGSNVDWSDVAMIVVGFGTSDSINLNDVGGVIDAFEPDLEAVIVDCFLRGVQPAIQTPVTTTMHVGDTVNYRNGNESVTIIQAIQEKLAQKYNLKLFSYNEQWQKAFSNYTGIRYGDFMADDMVHPNDMGHRIHSGYLVTQFTKRIAYLGEDQQVSKIFAGHPAWIPGDFSDIISPPNRGGTILTRVANTNISADEYIYEWLDSEGNGKAGGTRIMELMIYVEKPCLLMQTPVDNNRTTDKAFTVRSYLQDADANTSNQFEEYEQPEPQFFSHRYPIALLNFGLNKIFINASSDSLDQTLGGVVLVDLREMGNVDFSRGSAGTTYMIKQIDYPVIQENYTRRINRRYQQYKGYYNTADNVLCIFSLELTADLGAGTTYQIYTHYNDLTDYQEGYNLIEILGDDVTLKVATTGGESTVNTQNIPGLNALLVKGAKVTLQFKPQFFSPAGVEVLLRVDGVTQYNHTPAVGAIWSDGYGFDAPILRCKDISVFSRWPLRGVAAGDLNRFF